MLLAADAHQSSHHWTCNSGPFGNGIPTTLNTYNVGSGYPGTLSLPMRHGTKYQRGHKRPGVLSWQDRHLGLHLVRHDIGNLGAFPVLTSVNKLFSLWTLVWENRVISKEQRIPWPWPATSAAQPWSHPSTPAVTSRIASPARSHLASQPRHEPSWRRSYNLLTARFTPTSTQPTPHWNCWAASAAAQCLAPA